MTNMFLEKVENLISICEDIEMELSRLRDVMEEDEFEDWYRDNLDEAYDKLCDAKDLICG